MPETRPYSHKP